MAQRVPILAPISVGELLDKITILELKRERIQAADKLKNIIAELTALSQLRQTAVPESTQLMRLAAELKAVNAALWDIEDAIRLCERKQDFGPRFIELARSVYQHNDRRSALKRSINEETGSALIEEKSYEPTA